jgi:tRNA/tmRNA/rRNA uracil-C5-methylase (TrmA/RlmC/RlmD family)
MGKKLNWNHINPWMENSAPGEEQDSPSMGHGKLPEAGAELEGVVEDVAFGGEGVLRHDNMVIFVPGVITGEHVRVRIAEVKKSFARAELVSILKAMPDRVDPRCPLFGECGGCQYQHMSYESQLQMKQKQVRDIFERIGGVDGNLVESVLPCPSPYNYRNRIMVRTQWNRERREMAVGFLKYHSRLVVPVDECHIAEPELNEQLAEIRSNPSRRNGIKYVLRKFPEGWTLPRDSFFQNNFFLLPGMVDAVRQSLRDFAGRFLVDAYCGVGFFAIELAAEVEEFAGVEIDRMAIRAAEKNAADRRISNGHFIEGATETMLPRLMEKFPPVETTVVLDPPRRGIDPSAVEFLKRVGPGQILYVSCHPATQARDVATFCADGQYRAHSVKPMDMFPQTQHVECLADLRLAH